MILAAFLQRRRKDEKDGYNFSLCSDSIACQWIGKTGMECIRLRNGGNLFCAVFYPVFYIKDIEADLACKNSTVKKK